VCVHVCKVCTKTKVPKEEFPKVSICNKKKCLLWKASLCQHSSRCEDHIEIDGGRIASVVVDKALFLLYGPLSISLLN